MLEWEGGVLLDCSSGLTPRIAPVWQEVKGVPTDQPEHTDRLWGGQALH